MPEWSADLDRRLKDVLAQFARIMLSDFRLDAILDGLVTQIVALLPVTAAGVTLISTDLEPHRAAASDADALRFELLQSELGAGPCVEAYRHGVAVSIPDLTRTTMFPEFTTQALAAGLSAVFTFPLHHGAERLGALDLYRNTPGALSEQVTAAAQTLADVAAAYLINARGRHELKAASDRAHAAALHDALTGLPNRTLLVDRLEHALTRTARTGSRTALIYLDIDAFKAVNDTHGHATGDDLLVAVAQRIRGAVRPSDTAARLHGDEFAVLCEDLENPDQSRQVADRLQATFRAPFRLPVGPLSISASIGIALGVPGDQVAGALMHRADLAMFRAKRRGSGPELFTPELQTAADDLTALALDLHSAEGRGQLHTEYQPIVDLTSGRTTGFEALLRWRHPQRGPVSPTTVVALAEESGLITSIGRWVLRRALADRRGQSDDGAGLLTMAVNVSPRQLLAPDFVPALADALTTTPPEALHLEITESVLIADEDRAHRVLSQLKDMGVTLSLDDFGTGYSSLVYLKKFPFDIIKIDQTFVADLAGDKASHTIVSSVIDLVHALDMTVVAEGVETLPQRDTLVALGCDAGQGFYFARPGPLVGA